MARELWFRRSDKTEFSCVEGSETHVQMERDGAFMEIDGPGGNAVVAEAEAIEILADDPPQEKSLAKMNKTELLAKAAELGLTFEDPEAVKKADIVAAIETAIAEKDETGDGE